MASVPDLRQRSETRLRVPVTWCIVVAVMCAVAVGGATRLQHSTAASPFVMHALGERTPAAPLQRPMLADALQRVTMHGVGISTHGQSLSVALDGARGAWTRHANGVERQLPYGRESIVLTNLSAEELVTVDHRLGARTWRWRLGASLKPKLRFDGSVSLGRDDRSRLAILPAAILDARGGNVTPAGLRWSLARSGGSTWLQLRLDDSSLPLPYVIDPNIALTGTCPNSAGQTDIVGPGSVVAQSCSVNAVAGANPNTKLVLTAPSTLANNNVMIAQVNIKSGTAPTTPAGWTLINTTANGTALSQSLYYRVASGDTGGTSSWTWSDTAKADMSGGIIAFANVDTTSPVDVVSAGATGTSLTATAAAATTTTPNDQVLAFYSSANGVTLATSTYGGAATTELYSAESRVGGGGSDVDASAAIAPALQASPGTTGTSTASLSASQPWVAHTVALNTTSPSSVTFTGSRTKAAATATWTVGLTASTSGALSAGNTITITFPATWTGIPASPTVTFGGSFAGCSSTTASTAGTVVTATLPAGCTLANSASGTVAIAGITNPPAATYAASGFPVHTSADQADGIPAASVVIGAATPPTGVTFAGSRTKAGARSTWTAGFTASGTGALAAGDTVTVTFPATWTGIPASPSVTFGGSFSGCAAGTTGSTSGTVVTVTLPTGCSLTAGFAGTVLIAGITNPTNATYTNTTFKVHTSSDAVDASPAGNVIISVATSLAAASFTATTKIYGTTEPWTVSLTPSGTGALAAGDVVTMTFDSGFTSSLPPSPAITFGTNFAGCAAGATGSTTSNVVTVTLPTGCTLAANLAGTVVIAGVTDPAPATYTTANFKVHTSSDATDTSNSAAVTIAKKNLTITGAIATNKVYDATTTATVDFTGATLSGIVGADSVSINSSAYGASFATKTVGNAKAVTVAGVTLSGTNAGNYTVSQPTGLAANITAKALTITGVTANNKVYDATTAATLGGTAALSGVVAGDTVTLGGVGSGSFATKTVGNAKTVTVTGYTISGADSANYTLTQPSPTANITAKALTISGVTANNKVYDATTTATLGGSATLSGVVAGDTVALGGSASGSFADKTVANGKTVTVTGYTISGTDSANYTVSQPTGLTANITAKALTVNNVTGQNKPYDGTTVATVNVGTASLTGVIAGDTVLIDTSAASGAFATKTAGASKPVSVSNITITGADAGNYTLTQPSTTADITAKNLTISGASGNNRVYDATTVATVNFGSATLVGVVAGDSVSVDASGGTYSFATKAVGNGKAITVAGVALTGTDGGNYTVSQPTGLTANVTPAALSVVGLTAQNKTYDRNTTATLGGTASLSGVLGSDAVTLGGTASATFANSAVGTNKPVTVSGYTISGADSGNYALAQPGALTANITAKALTVTGISAQTKTYDRTTAATLAGTAALSGVISGDAVTLGGTASGSFADKAVATNKVVTVTGYTISGADVGNYTLTQPTLNADITAAALTVTGVTAQNKTYDRTTTATLTGTPTLTGVIGGDAVTLGGTASATFADKTVGTGKAVTVTGYTISGADAGNYAVTQPSLTANITAAPVTVTGIAAQSKTYDATTGATLSGTAALSGVVGGDTVALGGSAAASFADKNVGPNKPVSVSGYTITGADSGNYTLSQPTGLTATITAAPLTITGVSAQTKVYDATTTATLTGTAALSGVQGSDSLTLGGSPSASFADKNIGTGKAVTVAGYTVSGTDAGNYSFGQPTGLTANITAAALTVTGVIAQDKTYDAGTGATLGGAPLPSGVQGGDTVTIGGTATATFADKNVGANKTVTVSGYTLAGADAGNYALTQPTLTASITVAPLTVTGISAANKIYNASPAATLAGTATLSGKLGSDVVTLGGSPSANFADGTVGTNKGVTVSGYTISGADAANYAFSQPTGLTADITAKGLTVAGIAAQNKVYDRTTSATLTGTPSLVGVIGGDVVTLSGSASATFADATVGAAKVVTVSGYTITGADAGNYTLAQPSGTADITARALTVTGVSAQAKVYDGDTTATLDTASAALVGVIGADAVSLDVAGATGSFASKTVGVGKTVTVAGLVLSGADAGNYSVSQPTTTAAIIAKPLTVANVSAQNKIYDGSTAAALNVGTASLSGVVAGDTVLIDTSAAVGTFASKDAAGAITVNVTGITATGSDAANYTVTQPAGSADITAKGLTISGAVAQNKVYDATATGVVDFSGATLAGVVGPDSVSINSSAATTLFANKDVGTGKPITVTGVTLTGTDAADYTVAQPAGLTANITAAGLTISGLTANDKIYDRTTTATLNGSASLAGVFAGDTVNLGGTPTATFADKTVAANKPITINGYTISGTDAADYTLTQPAATASITAKTLTVTGINAQDKTYDRTTTATLTGSASLVGVIGADTVTISGTASASFADKTVGTGKTVTVTGYTISGADSNNYTLPQPTLTANITAAPLTVTGISAQNKTYDRTTSATLAGTGSLAGVIGADTVTLTGTPSASFATAAAGSAKVVTITGFTLGGADAANYTLTQPSASADVAPAGVTVTGVTASDKVYDGDATATLDVSSAALAGVISGDTVTLGGTPTGSFASKTVGASKTVSVTGLVLAGADAANYTLTQPTTTAAITTKALTISGVTATNRVYDGTTAAPLATGGATLVGKVAGDAVTLNGTPAGVFATKHVGTSKAVTVTGFAISGADAANYALSQPAGLTSDVTARAITVTAQPDAKTYDTTTGSSASPQVTSGSIAAGDTANFSQSFATATVGTGKTIVPSGAILDGNSGNDYAVTFVNGIGTITPGTAEKLAFTAEPPAASGGTTFSTQPEVAVEDRYGNVVTSDNTTHVTLSIGTNPSSGVLTCPTSSLTVQVANGVSTFAGCKINKGGTGYTLHATNDAGLTVADSDPFDVVLGGVSASNSTVSAPAVVVADGTTPATVTVTLVDDGGNPAAGKTVSLAEDAGKRAVIAPASAVSDANGQATFAVRDQTQEVVTLTATDVDDSVSLAATGSVSFEDHNAPSVTIGTPASAVDAAGTLALTATGVSDGETGVQGVSFQYCDGTCTTVAGTDSGGGTWTTSLDTTSLVTGRTYTWSATATDKANNSATSATHTFTVDNTVPVIAFGTPSLTGNAYYDGAPSTPRIWLPTTGGGTITLNATASDVESGIAKVHFPALLGTPGTDATGPYQAGPYTYNNQASDLLASSVVATNGVTAGDGANTASAAFDVKVDGTGPSATMAASLDGKIVSSGVLIGAASADGGSGVKQVSFLYCDRSTDALCAPSLPIGTATSPTLGTYAVTWTNTGLTDGDSYALAAVATDNVGNQTTSSISTVTVDNSAPAVAFQTPTTTGNAFFDGAKLFVKAGGTGAYTLHAHAVDAHSGIASVVFGASDTGTTTGGGNYDSSAVSLPVADSTATVTATNGVQLPSALQSTDSLQVVTDGTVPTVSSDFPVDNGGYDSNAWPTGCAAEGLCGTVGDTGAGVQKVALTLQDLGGGKYFNGTGFQVGSTALAATLSGNTWTYALAHAKLSTGTYELTITAFDNVGNTTTQTLRFQYGDDLTPPDTVLTLSNATHAFLQNAGSHPSPNAGNDYDLYYSTAGTGGFTLHAVSSDASGIDHVTFPAVFGTSQQTLGNGANANPWTLDSPSSYSFGSSDTTPPGQAFVTSVDTAIPSRNSGNDTITFLVDNAAPTGGSISVGPVDGNNYATTTSLTVSHTAYTDSVVGSGLASSVLTVASSSLANGTCGSFAGASPVNDGAFNATSGTCYRFTLTGTDNVGNVATTTQVVKVDPTAPSTPSVLFTGLSPANTYDDQVGTLWYRPSAGGTFTVAASSTDAESGIGGYTFSSLLAGTQTGGQLSVTFGAGGIGSGTYTVKSTNRAGLDSADGSFTVDADSTAPAGGALKVNGTDAAVVATSSYLTSGSSVTIDSRTDYTDGQSGLASSTLTVETATLARNACGSYGAPATVSGTTAQTVSNGHCYRFTLTGTDNVGNAASISTVVMLDATPPSTPSIVFSGLSAGNTYDDGFGKLWYRPSAGGTFTVAATGSTDPETDVKSGNAGYTFSSLTSFASAVQTGNALSIGFDGSSTGGGNYSVVSTNNAAVDSTPAAFSVAADTADPTAGLLSIAPYSSSLTVAIGEADFTDAQSGIASNVMTRSNPLNPSSGSCPGTGYSGATTVPVSGGAATDTVPADGKCYEYTLTGTDHVGNAATYTTIVLVDTTPASGGTVGAPDGLTSLTKISVDWNAGTDPESGISTIDVQRADATLSGATCGTFGAFNTIVTNAGTSPIVDAGVSAGNCYQYQIVVTNRAGVVATFTSSSLTKLTNASPITVAGSAAGAYLSGTTLYLGPAATTFGLQLTGVGGNGVTSATWSSSAGSLTGAGGTSSTSPFASPAYTWDQVAPLSTSISVTRQPTNTIDTLTVASDTTAPTGTVNQPNGVVSYPSVPVSTSGIGDGQSGVASVQIMRAETTLVGSTCGTTWSAFQSVTLNAGNDTSVQDEHCYQYQVVVTDNVGNVHTDTATDVVQIPDITAPTFSSAATDAGGTHLTITMSEPLDTGSTPSAGRFTVAYNGVTQPTPTTVQIVGSTVVLGLASPPNNSQTVTVRYASDGSLRDVATPSANSTSSFGPVAVTNNTPDTVAPMVSSAAVDGSTLTVRLDEALAGTPPDPSAFTVTVHGVARQVATVEISGPALTLTLNPGVDANDAVVAAYAVPALNALHDAAGNPVGAFTTSVTNSTAPVPPSAPSTTPAAPAPALVSSTPPDGATVPSLASFALTADRAVTWSKMTLTRPDGTVTPLGSVTGVTGTYAPGTTDQGLYVVRGTMTANGMSTDVLTHFTIFAPNAGGTTTMPPVQKNAGNSADTLATSDGTVVAAWMPQTFGGEPVVVQLIPQPPAARGALPSSAVAVDATAFLRDSHTPVTQLDDVLDLQFPHTQAGSSIETSQDGRTWTEVAQLPTLQLPVGQAAGWFRDSDGTTHVLTRHLTYFAVIPPHASTQLALRLTTPRRLWLDGRSFMAVRVMVTAPARVTGSFVAPNGKVIPGQVIRTPTRHAGSTILRLPLHIDTPGLYRLQVHAEGIGQTADRTARIRFVEHRPASTIWQTSGPLQVAIVRGVRFGTSTLRAVLGHNYVVRPVSDADVYAAVDPIDPRAATAVIVDLSSVPLTSLASLHALLPELRIIGLARNSSTAAAARAVGIHAVVARQSRAAAVTHMIKRLIPRR